MFLSPELKDLLGKIYDWGRTGEKKSLSREEYARRRHDFVFHMTDWLSDLKELSAIYEHPQDCDVEKTCVEIMGFLYHVVPHLNAAGRLLLDKIGDPFAKLYRPKKTPKQSKKTKRAG